MNHSKSLSLCLFLALAACGCAGASEEYPSDEAKAYFAAANEANYLGLLCLSPEHVDLSAYASYMGVKYPPTTAVEVLTEPPRRPYQAFAVLQCPASQSSPKDSTDVTAKLTNKAKSIGADAIILCTPPSAGQAAKAQAVAIKYRLENPEEKPRH